MKKNMYLVWSLLVCAIGFSIIGIMVSMNLIGSFDSTISILIQSNPSMVTTKISKALALIGGPKVEVKIAAVILIICIANFYRNKKSAQAKLIVSNAALFFTVNVVVHFSNSILKHLFQRHRPMAHSGSYSFPSDHAMMAVAFYITMAYLLWGHITSRMGRILLVLTCSTMTMAISLSRIYLNRHYPSDILAGFFVSGFILSIIILFWEKIERLFPLNFGRK